MAKALGIELALTNGGPQHPQSAQLSDTRREQGGAMAEAVPPDTASPGEEAAQRYIIERESKRQKIAGIPRHVLGELGQQGEIRYAGWRKVDGQLLLLARTGLMRSPSCRRMRP